MGQSPQLQMPEVVSPVCKFICLSIENMRGGGYFYRVNPNTRARREIAMQMKQKEQSYFRSAAVRSRAQHVKSVVNCLHPAWAPISLKLPVWLTQFSFRVTNRSRVGHHEVYTLKAMAWVSLSRADSSLPKNAWNKSGGTFYTQALRLWGDYFRKEELNASRLSLHWEDERL